MDNVKNVPQHIAIIMDGNRRWAREQGKPASEGHRVGAANLEDLAKFCNKIGVKYLTVYAFSTENWKRSEQEVSALMVLLKNYLKKFSKSANEDNIKINDINEDLIQKNLYTEEQPDPDLLIRPGGELRTSNFLPWQLVYTEFYFTDKYWPEFRENDLLEAIETFNKRNRKFGGK